LLCKQVYTVERYPSLYDTAGERFFQLGLPNIKRQVGDGTHGMPEDAPFDRIMVTAAAKDVPEALMQQLAPGGIMVVPLEERPGKQDLWRIVRDGQRVSREHLLPVRFVPLVEGVPDES
jgi:protein-L-isoaspartate(D-aspartate) O-methyltransferase